jgi:capsular polysaccharide biosynthesis protein
VIASSPAGRQSHAQSRFSHDDPSPRYLARRESFRKLFTEDGGGVRMPLQLAFPGLSLIPYASRIKRLIDITSACTVLDYACGKGLRYGVRPVQIGAQVTGQSLLDYWELAAVCRYDSAYEPHSRLPLARYDGVVCINALERFPEEDIPWVLRQLLERAGRFLFASVFCFAGAARLPDGEPVRCTVRPVAWWRTALLEAVASRERDLNWEFALGHFAEGGTDGELEEERLTNTDGELGAADSHPGCDDVRMQAALEGLEAEDLDAAARAMRDLAEAKAGRLSIAVCRDARLDPMRTPGEPYVAALSDVALDTAYWTVFDHEHAYVLDSYQRNFANGPLVNRRVSSDGTRYLVGWTPPSETIEQPCVLVGSDANYAHWLLRSLLKLWLVERDAQLRGLPWVVGATLTAFQREYLDALGVPGSKLLGVAADSVVRFRRLHVPTQMIGNRGFREGANWLRDKLSRWMGAPADANDLIYVARTDVTKRRLANEREVFEAIQDMGFRRIVPSALTVREQVETFSRARCLVAPHGAALANLVFAHSGTRVVEILSTNIASMHEIRWVASQLGQRMESVVSDDYAISESRRAETPAMHWDFRIPVERVRAAVARALAG